MNGYGYGERERFFCGSFSYLGFRHLFAMCDNEMWQIEFRNSLPCIF